DGLVYGIMRRALTTTHMTVSDDVSWRKIPRSKWYCGSHGSGSEPNKDGKKPVLPEDYAEVSCVAGKDKRLNLVELTRRQRKRLREKYYWDHVLWTHSRQLQRHRLWMRAKEDREFHEIIEEYQEILRREYEQMAQKQAAISVPRIAARPDEETARDRKQDVCLIDALRSLGVQLSYQDDGPFWALTDGNKFLRPHGKCLRSVDVKDCAMPGKYVLFRAKHFMSLEVRADGTNMWRTTCKRHVGCADVKLPLLLRAMEAAFQLKELSISFCEQETDVLGGASSEIPVVEKMLESSATPSSLAGEGSASTALQSPADWLQVCRNRARVLERKRKTTQDVEEHSSSSTCSFAHSWNLAMPPMTLQCFGVAGSPAQGVRIPLLPLDEGIVALPVHPTGQEVSPEFTWLRRCHPHELDAAIRFQQDGHKYYVHDAEMDCSVTSLIAKFSEEFDADRIIQKMMAGHRWPREGYMKNLQDESLQIRIAAMPGLEEVARILQAPATTQQQVSVVLRNTLYKCDETAASLLQQLVMTPEEIKVHWRENGETAAAAGTWVHLLCECVLNGGTVTGVSEEMRSFNAFLRSTQPLIAYRTEWCIWASAEKIAGSIDFVAQDAQGDLVLFDWKRTKGLPDKFENRFACMKPPLGHLPDATGETSQEFFPAVGEAAPGEDVAATARMSTSPRTAAKSQPRPADRPRAEGAVAAASNAPPPMSQEGVKKEDDDGLDLFGNDAAAEQAWRKLRQRRLMPGAATSDADFTGLFRQLADMNTVFQTHGQPEPIDASDTITEMVRHWSEYVQSRWAEASDSLIRLCVGALAFGRVRQADIHLREHAQIYWIAEGRRSLRFHNGDCYMRTASGAFQQHKGTEFLEACVNAALDAHTEPGRRGFGRGAEEEERPGEPAVAWTLATAKTILAVKKQLTREITEDKLLHYMSEWCDTPKTPCPSVSYEDCSIMYDDELVPARQVLRMQLEDCYLRIPHALRYTVPPHIAERLQKFYMQTFWGNLPVFKCGQAAQALAKRGINVVRLFIGLSSGGVGQSLYSTHLQAIYAHNFAFFDPNIWFHDEEMRKQVEQLNGCCILTGQETPATGRKLREDLYKKFVSGDGIAGRKPYGFKTRMINCVGWKRLEANRMFPFADVGRKDFNAILRRSLVWRVKARFEDPQALAAAYEDIFRDGVFPKDSDLADFLRSAPAVAAGLQLQHAFETQYSKQQCIDLIEDYVVWGGDFGLTETTMLEACGLPPRDLRHATSRAAAVINVEDVEEVKGAVAAASQHPC
ncbi:unnamed protein product, partial [Effrenium voratum]